MPLRRYGGIGSCLAPLLLAGSQLVAFGQPSFSLSSSTAGVTISPGQIARFELHLTSIGGFAGFVSLSYSLPSAVGTLRSAPAGMAVGPYSPSTGIVEIATAASAAQGAYPVIIQATGGTGILKTLTVNIVLALSPAPVSTPRFSMSVDPAVRSVAQGLSASFRIALQSQDGFTGAVALSVAGPSGFGSASFSPNPVTLAADGSASATLTLSIDRTAPVGAVAWLVRAAVAGVPMQEVAISLFVTAAPDFVLSATVASLTVVRGQSAIFPIAVQSRLGFTGPVTFSTGGLALGQASFNPNPAEITVTGLASTTLTIATSTATPSGVFAFTVRAMAPNAPDREQALSLTVAAVVAPAIAEEGIVSAAGFRPGLSRGAIASLFGSSLANEAVRASVVPLPRILGTTRVLVNGEDAPLFYAAPRQINFQVPFEVPLRGIVTVTVVRDGVTSRPVDVALAEYAPSIFVYERVPGVVDPIVTHPDGSLVTPENPATPDGVLVIYGTGIGELTEPVASAAQSPIPAAQAVRKPVITLGEAVLSVEFAGLTPGSIGLAQFNVRMPNTLLDAAPDLLLQIRFESAASQIVKLAVRQR